MATMVVDIDHLWANPIYDPDRCSIGFHLLHQPEFIALYLVLAMIPKMRLIGIGCLVHMALDGIENGLLLADIELTVIDQWYNTLGVSVS
jgi:hypothetical protein